MSETRTLTERLREEAMQNWCRQTWPKLYAYIYRRVQNRQEAEDLTQESYLRIFAHFNGEHGQEPPTCGYMRTVALNLIRDRWRRNQTRGTQLPFEESMLLEEREADRLVDRNWLECCLSELPDDYRQVLQLRIVEGYSRAETARRMKRTEASVRALQFRAVRALRDRIRTMEEVEKS